MKNTTTTALIPASSPSPHWKATLRRSFALVAALAVGSTAVYLTVPNLAHALSPYLGRSQATTTQTVEAGAAGAVLRDIFGGQR